MPIILAGFATALERCWQPKWSKLLWICVYNKYQRNVSIGWQKGNGFLLSRVACHKLKEESNCKLVSKAHSDSHKSQMAKPQMFVTEATQFIIMADSTLIQISAIKGVMPMKPHVKRGESKWALSDEFEKYSCYFSSA